MVLQSSRILSLRELRESMPGPFFSTHLKRRRMLLPLPASLQTNRIPPELRESMQEHLRLHFDTQDASDEQVSCCTSPGRLGSETFTLYLRSRLCRLFQAG